MTSEFDRRDIRLFDYAKQFAQPLRDAFRAHAELLAAEQGVEIEYIQRIKSFRKEDRISRSSQREAAARGSCTSSRPWSHAPRTGHGMTSGRATPSFAAAAASAFTITSTSSTRCSGFVFWPSRCGARSALCFT